MDFDEHINMLNARIEAKKKFLIDMEEEAKELKKLEELRDYLVDLSKFQKEQLPSTA